MTIFRKVKYFIFSGLSLLIAWGMFSYFMGFDIVDETNRTQRKIDNLEERLSVYTNGLINIVENSTVDELWEQEALLQTDFGIQVFRNDSLIYWNENIFPHQSYLQYQKNKGCFKLENGYYIVNSETIHDHLLVVSKKIKSEYPYQNENLENELLLDLNISKDITISLKDKRGSPIYAQNGDVLFYLTIEDITFLTSYQELCIFLLFLITLLYFLLGIVSTLKQIKLDFWIRILLLLILLVALCFLLIKTNSFSVFEQFEIFSPTIYASSTFLSSFGNLILLIFFITFGVWWLVSNIQPTLSKDTKINQFVAIISFLCLLPISHFISWLFKSIINNSSISLQVNDLFSLNIYSVIALLIIALLFLCYYLLANKAIHFLKKHWKATAVSVIWFLTGVFYFIFQLTYGLGEFYAALWPMIINGLLLFVTYHTTKEKSFGYRMLILTVFSVYSANSLHEYNEKNEHQKREVYANQLITDKDPEVEIEYLTLKSKIQENYNAVSNFQAEGSINSTEFKEDLDLCCLSAFWDRFDISYYLFDSAGKPLLDYVGSQNVLLKELKNIINQHGVTSEFSPTLYFIKDYHKRLSYMAELHFKNSHNEDVTLILQLRSKKIPEQLGIPRLLINQSANILDDLEDYSIARYSGNNLIMRFGDCNYPTTTAFMLRQLSAKSGFVDSGGYSHLIYRQVNDQYNDQFVVVSRSNSSFFQNLTSFSYLFLFFGLVLLVVMAISSDFSFSQFNNIQLSIKIQLVLIGIVIISFVLYGLVATSFVKDQYATYTFSNLKERIESVEIEVRQKLGDREDLDPDVLGLYMEYILKKFSNVFVTDINLYGLNGSLLASSQPMLYSKGISAEQMNPIAYKHLVFQKSSEFIHREKIGNLNYLSAYIPFNNNNSELTAFLNLQHFAKQRAYEHQISNFLVAILNIAVLLLVATIIVALFIANWITTPLRMIHESFKTVELGKQNKPIDYKGDDEIGALVKDYNDKLTELELKAMQLARSERESAWREMAKQVAHEIKNPLTPMKLSLQHFQRSYDPKAENAEKKLKHISESLIEQIDGLTRIANEFSNFAKMPKANEEEIDLLSIIQNCKGIFESEMNQIGFNSKLEKAHVFADKNLIIRVFNNILKNALQAIPDDRKPTISIRIVEEREGYLISISDNGVGIEPSEKSKVFVPNFTTKSTGAGLGLAMVQQIVHNHNGEIWFESSPPTGTTFFIYLPGISE